jgi:ubiquinone/menaquinone biosynthesis C-methylase UbiE
MDSPSAKSDWNNFSRANASRQWRRQSAVMGQNVTEAIVEAAQVARGMRVLDIACGTGEPSISIATLLNGTGEVVGMDISPEALNIAEERATQRQLSNVRFQQADAHDLPFPESSFDRITSRLGVMFFADLPRALSEIHRVLKPCGRAVLLAWGPMEQPYFETTIGAVLRALPGAKLPESATKMFAFGRSGILSQRLIDAGFTTADEKIVTRPWSWPGDPEDVWAYFQEVAVPFAPLLKSVPQELRNKVDNAVVQAISPYYDGKEIKFTAIVNIASAMK